jgi:hypothetical protein
MLRKYVRMFAHFREQCIDFVGRKIERWFGPTNRGLNETETMFLRTCEQIEKNFASHVSHLGYSVHMACEHRRTECEQLQDTVMGPGLPIGVCRVAHRYQQVLFILLEFPK